MSEEGLKQFNSLKLDEEDSLNESLQDGSRIKPEKDTFKKFLLMKYEK